MSCGLLIDDQGRQLVFLRDFIISFQNLRAIDKEQMYANSEFHVAIQSHHFDQITMLLKISLKLATEHTRFPFQCTGVAHTEA